jgi:dihydrofolate reductase
MYQVATSVDGYIAGPNGEHDWITLDVAIMPVVLGKGTKLFDTGLPANFVLTDHVALENSGVVILRYAADDRLNGMPPITYVKRDEAISGPPVV